MRRVRLIHWKPEEAKECVRRITESGFHCLLDAPTPGLLRGIRYERLSAVVIDLSRLPMQGRDVGVALRHSKATRQIPLVFAGGAPEKVDRVRAILPDAIYCKWPEIEGALRRAVGPHMGAPIAPKSSLAAYAGAPLAQKLGLKAGLCVRLIRPPEDFDLLDLCPEASLIQQGLGDLAIWFVRTLAELEEGLAKRSKPVPKGGLWILYRRQKSGRKAEPGSLTQFSVRETANRFGLVDYKITRLDDAWTGMRFAERKPATVR